MIVVDSSVWIDFFNGRETPEVDTLDRHLGQGDLMVGDLIATEVLQGFRHDRDVDRALGFFATLEQVEIAGFDIAVLAARHFRLLRAKGITVRKTIDCLIATRCVTDGFRLLYSDRDFDPYVQHLGLRPAAVDVPTG